MPTKKRQPKKKDPGKKLVNCLLDETPSERPKFGRPPKYPTVELLEAKIEEYFESCWVDKVTETTSKDGEVTMSTVRYQNRPYTVTGLALHLNMTRRGLLDYCEKGDDFAHTVTRAKAKVEMFAEESLFLAKNPTGPAFSLKNNYGWKDKQEIEHSGNIDIAERIVRARKRGEQE